MNGTLDPVVPYLGSAECEKPCSKEREMYRKTCQTQELPEIDLYFAGRLNPENRWVKMADLVPWEEVAVRVCPTLQKPWSRRSGLECPYSTRGLADQGNSWSERS